MALTKDVLITIQGLQFVEEDVRETVSEEELDTMKTICPGEYYYRNGAHFVLYEELTDEFDEPVKNLVKFRNKEFALTKKGPINVQMLFLEGKKTMSDYATPFGNILIGLDTKELTLEEGEDLIRVHICYELEANYQFIATCDIRVEIKKRTGV